MKQNHLGDAELDIMLALWSGEGPMTSAQVKEKMRGKRDWALSSLYAPLVSEERYRAGEGAGMLEKLWGNSVGSLVASLYEGKVIGNRELSELRELIDALEKGEPR